MVKYERKLSKTEAWTAASWCNNYNGLLAALTHPDFTAKIIEDIMIFELQNGRRINLLKRLHARLYKLRKEEDWKQVEEIIDARKTD